MTLYFSGDQLENAAEIAAQFTDALVDLLESPIRITFELDIPVYVISLKGGVVLQVYAHESEEPDTWSVCKFDSVRLYEIRSRNNSNGVPIAYQGKPNGRIPVDQIVEFVNDWWTSSTENWSTS